MTAWTGVHLPGFSITRSGLHSWLVRVQTGTQSGSAVVAYRATSVAGYVLPIWIIGTLAYPGRPGVGWRSASVPGTSNRICNITHSRSDRDMGGAGRQRVVDLRRPVR